jgi:hypothetical protein
MAGAVLREAVRLTDALHQGHADAGRFGHYVSAAPMPLN